MLKVIVIGASSGIGLQVAADFARLGCRVGMAARRTEPMEAIRTLYPDRTAIAPIDVTAPDAEKRFYDLIELIDGMDMLVYCSGAGFMDPDLEPTITRRITDTNCTGFATIMAAAYKYYRSTAPARPGRIAAVTSVAGTKGIGVAAAYSASKRFQSTFIDALEQLAYQQQVNVRFTEIRPGFVRTPFLSPERTYPMEMPLSKAARLVELAALRAPRRITIDSRWAAVDALWRRLPQRLWRHISLTM